MKKEQIIKEIDKLKKYCVFKTHHKKIDDYNKEQIKLKGELYAKEKIYNKMLDTNVFIKKQLKDTEEEYQKYKTLFQKVLNYIKYTKLKKKYEELKEEVKQKVLVEEKVKSEINAINKIIQKKLDSISDLCGFEYSELLYSEFTKDMYEKSYYCTNLYELIEKLEKDLENE